MIQPHWNLITHEELDQLPLHLRYLEYADAYLDSARRLCAVLARSHRKASFQRGAVVLYLLQHALELFYKGAIISIRPNERSSHGIARLRARYDALFPGKDYYVRPLFIPSYSGLNKIQIAQAKVSPTPVDQLFRYPEDKHGEPWEGIYAFEAISILGEIDALLLEFKRVREKLAVRKS